MDESTVDLTQLSTADLAQWNRRLDDEGAVIRAQRLAIVSELNTREANAKVKKMIDGLTPTERAVVLEVLTAEGMKG